MSEPIHDLAHIGHAELLTPFAADSERFFVELFGMEVEGREGSSVYLRGWGDYQRYSLKLTESELPGLGPHRDPRLEPGGAASGAWRRSRRPGSGSAGSTATTATGRPTGSPIRTATAFELYYESDRYEPPPELRPALKNVPQRNPGRGAAVKRLDHINVLAQDVAANRRFAQEELGFRLYEQIVLNDGTESGAWMSLTIAAHELIYVADNAGARGRLHHFAFFVDTREEVLRAADLMLDSDVPIEAAPSKHAIAQGMFLYVYEPGGNRVEVTTGTHFIYDPEYEPVVWTEAERARGQAWGVRTIETFHTYGTPDLSGRRERTADPADQPGASPVGGGC